MDIIQERVIMKVTFIHIALLLLLITAGHFYANASGLYEGGFIWADNVLHLVLGLVALYLGFFAYKDKTT